MCNMSLCHVFLRISMDKNSTNHWNHKVLTKSPQCVFENSQHAVLDRRKQRYELQMGWLVSWLELQISHDRLKPKPRARMPRIPRWHSWRPSPRPQTTAGDGEWFKFWEWSKRDEEVVNQHYNMVTWLFFVVVFVFVFLVSMEFICGTIWLWWNFTCSLLRWSSKMWIQQVKAKSKATQDPPKGTGGFRWPKRPVKWQSLELQLWRQFLLLLLSLSCHFCLSCCSLVSFFLLCYRFLFCNVLVFICNCLVIFCCSCSCSSCCCCCCCCDCSGCRRFRHRCVYCRCCFGCLVVSLLACRFRRLGKSSSSSGALVKVEVEEPRPYDLKSSAFGDLAQGTAGGKSPSKLILEWLGWSHEHLESKSIPNQSWVFLCGV